MSNEEIARVMDFIIQRQEVFAQNQEVAQSDTQQLKRSLADLTARVTHLTDVVGEVASAQMSLIQTQERLQGDISNMLKITTGLFEMFMKDGGKASPGDPSPG